MAEVIIGIIFIIAVIVVYAITAEKREQRAIKSAGDEGEALFSDWIRSVLNDDDFYFSNIRLDEGGRKAEIDNLIINKNGIFIVEVKNYNGILYGDADDYEWRKEKIFPGGKIYTKTVRNPIKQLKRQIYILSQYLKDNQIRIWINGYVYFIHNNSPVDDACVINDISEFEKIIHKKQGRTYEDKQIRQAIRLLIM